MADVKILIAGSDNLSLAEKALVLAYKEVLKGVECTS